MSTCAIEGCRVVPTRNLPATPLCQEHFERLRLEFMPAVYAHFPPHTWLAAGRQYRDAFGEPDLPRWVQTQPVTEAEQRHGPDHQPLVYFIVWGDRCKIGTTVNLPRRLATFSLPPDAVRHTRPGSYQVEQQLHARFSSYRIAGTEWFRIEGTLAAFLDAA